MDRKERRARTRQVAAKRHKHHLNIVHDGDDQAVDCVCELADTYFAKRGALACRCGKRRHGRPKLGYGVCGGWVRTRIYSWRRQSRLLKHVVSRALDYEADEVAVLENPINTGW